MRLPASLWDQIARNPFNYTITAWTLPPKCDDYQFQRLILQFPALGKYLSYCEHVHHNPSSKYASRCWAKRTWIHVLWDTLLFVRYSPFYLYLFLFSFAFLSPSSIYFGVLSNFLARFSRLALRLLLLAFFGRSVSFFPAIFTQNPLSTNLKYNNFPLLTKL